MDTPLPSNDDLESFSHAVLWDDIENQKRAFNSTLKELTKKYSDDSLPLNELQNAVGVPLELLYESSEKGNVIYAKHNGVRYMLGSFVSKRYRKGKTLLESVTPYNFNPSAVHTNLHETDNTDVRMRSLGAELELGLYHPDGSQPSADEVNQFITSYSRSAKKLGIVPTVDREACEYQVEVHIAPGVGYTKIRESLDHIFRSLVTASQQTGLNTAILSTYPVHSDFRLSPDPKVQTAVDVMVEVNNHFPQYMQELQKAITEYHLSPETNFVEAFRLQGCHIHLDIAGRSEALGLLTFYTMLRSATAIANKAMLKGGPFVNGTCDAELLCTRERLRRTTVTGRYLEIPVSPHFEPNGMERYGDLLRSERANAAVRGLLRDDSLGEGVSVMHNPIGRVRPDLGMTKRICTVESTGMPINISAARIAAVLADFEFTHILIENYFRKYGCDLEPMRNDSTLWAILGPLSTTDYIALQDHSDRTGTDMTIRTAAGTEMGLVDFYELKRDYMHRNLIYFPGITPRTIDDVYGSFRRMLDPPAGRKAETVHEFVADRILRSTGNWGMILRNAFIEEGGTPGEHNPDAVLRVANQVHEALCERYNS